MLMWSVYISGKMRPASASTTAIDATGTFYPWSSNDAVWLCLLFLCRLYGFANVSLLYSYFLSVIVIILLSFDVVKRDAEGMKDDGVFLDLSVFSSIMY